MKTQTKRSSPAKLVSTMAVGSFICYWCPSFGLQPLATLVLPLLACAQKGGLCSFMASVSARWLSSCSSACSWLACISGGISVAAVCLCSEGRLLLLVALAIALTSSSWSSLQSMWKLSLRGVLASQTLRNFLEHSLVQLHSVWHPLVQ